MKKILFIVLTSVLAACGSTSSGGVTGKVENPTEYCRSVGGQVKTVSSGNESFCLLPGGDVVKLQEFYDNNH